MSEKDLIVRDLLCEIEKSIEMIIKRVINIKTYDDFLINDENIAILDSVSMRLLAIGEGFKQIDKLTDKILSEKYPNIDWKSIKGMRDILSHHYFDIDAEIIYETCQNQLQDLLFVVQEYKRIIEE